MSEKIAFGEDQAAGLSPTENASSIKKTPSKRKSHIERIQEENKELLKSMGIEELATSESRSTRRSTRSNTKGTAPVTPPTPKLTPATPTSSRRGKKKKEEEDEDISKEDEGTKVAEKDEIDALQSTAEEKASPTQSTPPRKRQKLSETATEKDSVVEASIAGGTLKETKIEESTENFQAQSIKEQSAELAEPMEVDSGKVCTDLSKASITDVGNTILASVAREPIPEVESTKIEESVEQQISSTSEKTDAAPLEKEQKLDEITVQVAAEESADSSKPAAETFKVESVPTQVFEVSSENKSQLLAEEKTSTLENITEQSKVEATQDEPISASIETESVQ